MKQQKRPVKKWIWWVIVPLAVLAGALVAYILLLGDAGASARYDDAETLLAGYTPENFRGVTVEADGTATIRLEKADLYRYAEDFGLRQEIRDYLNARSGMENARFGFRIVDGRVVIYISARVGTLIPVAYRAVLADMSSGTELRLRAEKVTFGSSMALSEKHWPELFRSDLALELDREGMFEGLSEVRLEGDALILKTEGLRMPLQGQLTADEGLLAALRLFGCEQSVDSDIFSFLAGLDAGEVPMKAAEELVLSAEDVPSALAELMALCTPESRASLWEGKPTLIREYVGGAVEAMAAQRRAELEKYAGTAQSRCEKLLNTVRELYKSRSLRVDTTEFCYASTGKPFDPTGLYSLSVTAYDSRIVFLGAGEDPSELRLSDMPALDTVPRGANEAFRNMDRSGTYDLGYVLTTEGGVTVLLHYREDGAFVLREICPDCFVAALVAGQNPVICPDDLDPPAVRLCHDGSSDWNRSVIELLER